MRRANTEGLTDDGPDEEAKVIVRSNGTVTYVGKDIAYHLWKFGLLPGKDFYYEKFHLYGVDPLETSDESVKAEDLSPAGSAVQAGGSSPRNSLPEEGASAPANSTRICWASTGDPAANDPEPPRLRQSRRHLQRHRLLAIRPAEQRNRRPPRHGLHRRRRPLHPLLV